MIGTGLATKPGDAGVTDPAVADLDAPAAPPRSNGELVFEEPWESRAFGIAVALHDAGVLDFEMFRARLIERDRRVGGRARPVSGADTGTTSAGSPRSSRVLEAGLVDAEHVGVARAALEEQWVHDRHG